MTMKFKLFWLIAILLLPYPAFSQEWIFSKPLLVSDAKDKVYHHLESAGRRNISVTPHTTAIVWEDDRAGVPSVYLALKQNNEANFETETKISGDGDAFEPSITALNQHHFVISWEEDSHIWLRVVNTEKTKVPVMGKAIKVSTHPAMYASLSFKNNSLFLTYSERKNRFSQIKLITLKLDDLKIIPQSQCYIDKETITADQLYPTLVALKNYQLVAWEDRRPGHTIIMASEAHNDCDFSSPTRVSLRPGSRKPPYGKGHGVSRVAITEYGHSNIMAAWADKRDFREGYDIYSAPYSKTTAWGDNQRVQDDFGGLARQWHTTISGHPDGHLVSAWTDDREGNTDIFFSWYEDGEWSDDHALPGASGPYEENHPSITFDQSGNIHITWISRKEVGGATELYYMMGTIKQ